MGRLISAISCRPLASMILIKRGARSVEREIVVIIAGLKPKRDGGNGWGLDVFAEFFRFVVAISLVAKLQ